MTTTTLSSKSRVGYLLGAMLRKNMTTAIYMLVVLLFFFPLQMFLETQRAISRYQLDQVASWSDLSTPILMYTSVSVVAVFAIMTCATVIVGLIQVNYLHSKRAVDLYHSLPVTRIQLMSAGFGAAYLTITVPFTISYILNLCILLARKDALALAYNSFYINPWEILNEYLSWLVVVFVILAIIYFVATCVGSIFENFIFTCELLLAPVLVLLISQALFSNFLLGYSSTISGHTVASLSPLGVMVSRYMDESSLTQHNIAILVWLVLGIAALATALVLYRRRHSELAETSGCHGLLGIIFSALAVYVAAPVFGMLLCSTLGGGEELPYMVGVVAGSVITYLLMAAILNRGFYGMKKLLPVGAGICAFVVAVSAVVATGGLGYETRMPSPEQVRTATIDYRGWYGYASELDASKYSTFNYGEKNELRKHYEKVTDVQLSTPEAVQAVLGIHQKLLALAQQDNSDGQAHYFNAVSLGYDLGGSTLQRRYTLQNEEQMSAYSALEETKEFQEQTNPLLRLDAQAVMSLELSNNLGFPVAKLENRGDIDKLMAALAEDSRLHGTQGFAKGERVLCYIDVEMPLLNFYAQEPLELTKNAHNSFSVPVFERYQNTLRVLQAGEGAEALQPGKAETVNEISFSRYDQYKVHNYNGFVSGVNKSEYYYAKDSEGSTQEQHYIQAAMDNQINFSRTGDDSSYLYCTFIQGEQAGITVMVPVDKMPASIWKDFPEMMSEYADETRTGEIVMMSNNAIIG